VNYRRHSAVESRSAVSSLQRRACELTHTLLSMTGWLEIERAEAVLCVRVRTS